MTTSHKRRPPQASLTHAVRDGKPRKTPHQECPACGRVVRILPPRQPGAGRRAMAPRRRQQHREPDTGARCRFPVTHALPEETPHGTDHHP